MMGGQQMMPPATPATKPASGPAAPTWRSLLGSEVLRARSRRSLPWLVGVALLAVVGVATLMFAFTGRVEQADLDAAADRAVVEAQRYYEECLADPGMPAEEKDDACWRQPEAEIRQQAFWHLDRQPFASDGMTGLLTFAGALATLVGLLIGATAGGADWAARTFGLLFTWEPRRLRVFLTRLGVVSVLAALVTVLTVGLASGLGSAIAAAHPLDPAVHLPEGIGHSPVDPGDTLELLLRFLPVGVLAAAAGFGIAMVTRSTGWAVGATVAAVVIVEPIIQALWAWGSQWLVQVNLAAWLQGGMEWVVDRRAYESGGSVGAAPAATAGVIWLSDVRAIITLVVMCLVVLGLAAVLLRRRDVD